MCRKTQGVFETEQSLLLCFIDQSILSLRQIENPVIILRLFLGERVTFISTVCEGCIDKRSCFVVPTYIHVCVLEEFKLKMNNNYGKKVNRM